MSRSRQLTGRRRRNGAQSGRVCLGAVAHGARCTVRWWARAWRRNLGVPRSSSGLGSRRTDVSVYNEV